MDKLELKPGDEVLVRGRYHQSIKKVKRVTPMGNIRLEDDSYYDMYGNEKNSDAWYRTNIVKATSEVKEKYRQREVAKDTLYAINKCRVLTYEQAVQIRAALGLDKED